MSKNIILNEIASSVTELKIILIGKCGSGKTSFVNRWVKDSFSQEYKSTIVSEYSSKTYEYKDKTYNINLWDIAGQDHFEFLIKSFCRDSHGCITISDISVPSSLKDALKWKKSLDDNQTFLDGTAIPNILVQNKSDLIKNKEENDAKNFEEFAKNNKFDAWFQTSAKTGKNISEVMDKLIQLVVNKLDEINLKNMGEDRHTITLNPDKSSEIDKIRNAQRGCC